MRKISCTISVKALEEAFSVLYGHPVAVKFYPVELGADDQDYAVIGALEADLVGKVSNISEGP